MKVTFADVEVKESSRAVPGIDRKYPPVKVRWFADCRGEVWLNARDMGMGGIGAPNTCGNCIQWGGCKVKDRDACPGDFAGGSEWDPSVTQEDRMEALLAHCRNSREQLRVMGFDGDATPEGCKGDVQPPELHEGGHASDAGFEGYVMGRFAQWQKDHPGVAVDSRILEDPAKLILLMDNSDCDDDTGSDSKAGGRQ